VQKLAHVLLATAILLVTFITRITVSESDEMLQTTAVLLTSIWTDLQSRTDIRVDDWTAAEEVDIEAAAADLQQYMYTQCAVQ